MGQAGKALKQVLETHNISQNRLAVKMGVGRSNVHRWVYEVTDPVAEAVIEIRNALSQIDPKAADQFIKLYLGEKMEDEARS